MRKVKEIKTVQLESKPKGDSTRYFAALKEMKNERSQNTIVVKDQKGKAAVSEGEQITIITQYFKRMLAPGTAENNLSYYPKEMQNPFTDEEIQKAAKKLKNGKITGPDEVELELIKYAPLSIHNEIADIFNNVTRTGEQVTELILGILRPLQKPGKAKGPVENLRPIILLSVLRKILTIRMIERTWTVLKNTFHLIKQGNATETQR